VLSSGKDAAEHREQTAAASPSDMDVSRDGSQHSRGRDVDFRLSGNPIGQRQIARDHVYSEIADLHVATLASSSPVDVISTDRHTVKPWFQENSFAFNLPELQNSDSLCLEAG